MWTEKTIIVLTLKDSAYSSDRCGRTIFNIFFFVLLFVSSSCKNTMHWLLCYPFIEFIIDVSCIFFIIIPLKHESCVKRIDVGLLSLLIFFSWLKCFALKIVCGRLFVYSLSSVAVKPTTTILTEMVAPIAIQVTVAAAA